MTEYGSGGSYTVKMGGPYGGGSGGSESKLNMISAPVANWKGGQSPYSQVVDVSGLNVNSKVDIQLNVDQLMLLLGKSITFTTVNVGGVVTLYAIGEKPDVDCLFQATLSDVTNISDHELSGIMGNTVSTRMPSVVVGNTVPEGPAIWFNTEPGSKDTAASFVLEDDETGHAVQVAFDGETYGIPNATVNNQSPEASYNFTVL